MEDQKRNDKSSLDNNFRFHLKYVGRVLAVVFCEAEGALYIDS